MITGIWEVRVNPNSHLEAEPVSKEGGSQTTAAFAAGLDHFGVSGFSVVPSSHTVSQGLRFLGGAYLDHTHQASKTVRGPLGVCTPATC